MFKLNPAKAPVIAKLSGMKRIEILVSMPAQNRVFVIDDHPLITIEAIKPRIVSKTIKNHSSKIRP
jgi:hypothetical protein